MTPYYEQDGIVIYHGDCREVLPTLAPASFNLVVTSPPYNLGVTTGGGFPLGHYAPDAGLAKRGGCGKWSGGALADGYGAHGDAMPPAAYEQWQRETLTLLWVLLTDTGAIYYNHKPRVQGGILWTPLAMNPGLPVRQIVIWKRAGGINFSPAFYVPTHEWIVVFAKPDFRLRSKGASGAGDVWDIPQESGTPHPAPFPVMLPFTAIETTGAQRILDPFVGWGSTLVAARRLGRQAVGIELEERNCELAARRLGGSHAIDLFGEATA
jgi:site-specific DNA-methyltransferase (adenine-specific)